MKLKQKNKVTAFIPFSFKVIVENKKDLKFLKALVKVEREELGGLLEASCEGTINLKSIDNFLSELDIILFKK